MPDIAPVDINNPGNAAELLDAVKSKMGRVPNIFATMAHSPAALNAYLSMGAALGDSSLSARLREQIALTVAGTNGCDYCASAHTAIAKSLGVDNDEAARNLTAKSDSEKVTAILEFARDIVEKRAWFDDNASRLNALRNSGVSDAEIVEIIAVVAQNIFTNYFNHIAGTDVDFPHVASRQE